MYKMNEWKQDHKIESQADTYIERHFEEASRYLNNGFHILNEWRCRKSKYISYTNVSIFSFQHYSRHDVSHSVNILESIELVLGKERIEKLSAGDLWLLLEGAYYHDIGMSLSYEDLINLWKDEKFKEYIKEGFSQWDSDYKNAASWYTQIDNLLQNRPKMEGIEKENELEFEDTWPVELERKLLFLVADYVRKDHPQRSSLFLSRFDGKDTGAIPKRLYQLVVDISIAHGENFSYIIKKLKEKQKGFGIDTVHPRFIASMLRIGDLLDMDNNRFSERAMEHYGKLPYSSELHLKKHKAMSHILVSSRQIEAEAVSDDFDVCRVTNDWFRYIKEEVTNLIAYWNEMAPEEIGGCIMQQAKCVVYHPSYPTEFNMERQQRFEVDKVKLTDLLIGTNIYDVKLDFLREYIQNALDATKMRIWMELKDKKYQHKINPDILDWEKLAPFDVPQKVYDEYMIEIGLDLDMRKQEVVFTITDHGIGMEKDCIGVISRIGAGWRQREHYNSQIPKMLKWLKPTGGFGIGIQSAFMVTDTVEITTRSENESFGHKITLNSPRTTGDVFEESGDKSYSRGTSVMMRIPLRYFQLWSSEYMERNKGLEGSKKDNDEAVRKNSVQELLGCQLIKPHDVFDRDETLNYVIRVLHQYLQKIICNPLVPITILCPEKKPIEYRSAYMISEDYWKRRSRYKEIKWEDAGWEYRCIYDCETNVMILWNQTDFVFTVLGIRDRLSAEHTLAFKNICVVRDTDFYFPYGRIFNICIDFMGHSAEETLKVHRNAFNENFLFGKYLESNIRVFFKCMAELSENLPELDDRKKIEENLWNYPLPLVRRLYFEDVDISKTTDMDGRCVSVLKWTIQNVDSDQAKCIISQKEEVVDLKNVMELLNLFLEENQNRGFFVSDFSKKKDKKEVDDKLLFKGNIVLDWLNKETVPDKVKEENAETWKVLDKFKENDFKVINDADLVALLIESGRFVKTHISFFGQNSSFIMLTWKEEKEQKIGSEKEFFEKMYGTVQDERYIAFSPESGRYEKLTVSEVPYGVFARSKGPFLISPIDEKIRQTIDLERKIGGKPDKEKQYPLEKFEKLITESEGYEALLNWVYENQVEKKKYKISDIDKAYRKLIKDIYQHSGIKTS